MKTKTLRTTAALGIAIMLAVSLAPTTLGDDSGGEVDCEELLNDAVEEIPEDSLGAKDALEAFATQCDPCELIGCEDWDPQVSIVALAWSGVDDPIGFPDAGVLRTEGCTLDEIYLLGHEWCSVTYDSILWPGEFAADCIIFDNGDVAGTLTYFGLEYFCTNVIPALPTCSASTTGGEITLSGEEWRDGPTIFGNGVGIARC